MPRRSIGNQHRDHQLIQKSSWLVRGLRYIGQSVLCKGQCKQKKVYECRNQTTNRKKRKERYRKRRYECIVNAGDLRHSGCCWYCNPRCCCCSCCCCCVAWSTCGLCGHSYRNVRNGAEGCMSYGDTHGDCSRGTRNVGVSLLSYGWVDRGCICYCSDHSSVPNKTQICVDIPNSNSERKQKGGTENRSEIKFSAVAMRLNCHWKEEYHSPKKSFAEHLKTPDTLKAPIVLRHTFLRHFCKSDTLSLVSIE